MLNGPTPRRLRRLHRGGELVGGHGHVARDAAEARGERAEIDGTIVAVARRGAGKLGEIALAAGIDEGAGAERVLSAMVLPAEIDDAAVGAGGAADEGVEHHLHAGLGAQRIEDELDGFGIEHDEDAAMALRAGDGAEPAQALHDLLGNALHGLARLVAQRVQTAVGEHIAQRRRAAEAGALFEQDRACPAARRSDGGGGTGAAAADDGDVEWLTIHAVLPLSLPDRAHPARS